MQFKREDGWHSSTCQGCTTWCPVEIKVVDGRAVDVRGNSVSKAHHGKVCVRAQQALLQVYDPDRVKVPLRRTNPKKGKNEDPEFVPITWDEAIDEISDKIIELKENNETHKSAIFRGRYTKMTDILFDSFANLLGTPNSISHSGICAEAEKFGPYYTEGYWGYHDYNLENAKYLLLWGVDPLAANRQVPHASHIWNDLIENASITTIDPRYSTTAIKSDEWLPVIPGQDGALGLAIAHVILTAGLWNRKFVGDFLTEENLFVTNKEISENSFEEKYTHGLIKWWNLELKDKTPQWAAKLCGIEAQRIKKIAIEFAKAGPQAISWTATGPTMKARGSYTSMILHALNALVGSVDNKGGILQKNNVPLNSWPDYRDYLDDAAKKGLKKQVIDQRGYKEFPALKKGVSGKGVVTGNVAQAILAQDPYPLKLVFSYWNNYNFSNGDTAKWNQALAEIDFYVHLVTHLSENSHYADIVLPAAHHMFERWGCVNSVANQYSYNTLNQPVIERLGEVKTEETEVPWLIAKRLAEKGYPEAFNYYQKNYQDPETGKEAKNSREFELYALKKLTQPLWDLSIEVSGERLKGWQDYISKGVWHSERYDNYKALWDNFKTVTNKFEFYSETLKEALKGHAQKHKTTVDDILKSCNYQARGEKAFIPHYERPYRVGDEKEYPFLFVDYKSRLNREGRSANIIIGYHDIKDADPGDERNLDVARINPQDAIELEIKTGDKIKISSPTGEIKCFAKVWAGVRPGTVSKAYGQGHWAYGKLASKDYQAKKANGGNNNAILPAEYDRLSGSTARQGGHRVKIEKL